MNYKRYSRTGKMVFGRSRIKAVYKERKSIEERCRKNALRNISVEEDTDFFYDQEKGELYRVDE